MGSPGGGVGGSSGSTGGSNGPGNDSPGRGSDDDRPSSTTSTSESNQAGMTGSERTQDAEAKNDKSFDESLTEAKAENERSKSPNEDGGQTATADTDDNDATSRGGGLLDRIADTLTAPPTDAEGNARSTSPIADRINNTKNYSFDDVGTFLGNLMDAPEITPERRQSLADGAAVIDGVIIKAAYPKQPPFEPLSRLQGAAALADAELSISMEVYERETNARISEIDERIIEIDRQGISPIDAHLAKERIDLAQESERLSESLTSPDAVEEALRGGDEKIGMRAETLEMVVIGRDNLAKQIKEKEAELELAAVSDVVFINEKIQALHDAKGSMLDLGLAYQDLVDQEAKLAVGDTVHISRTRPQSWSEFVANEAIGSMVGFGIGNLARVPKYVDHVIDAISGTVVSQQLHKQQGEVLEGVVSVRQRDDGVYEVTVSEPYDPNATWSSKISQYEIMQNGEVWSTGTWLDGGNLQGNPIVERQRERVNDLDLGALTNGNVELVDGTVRIAPDLRKEAEHITLGTPTNP